uniref:5-formyltetrahydrofolate cyclo-ligase n=1 Tax=Pinctada fucata TaxID=50426 RepID=A0A194AN03_PINFU
MSVVKSAKAVLRKKLKIKLADLSDHVKQEQSKVVERKLLSLKEFQHSQRVSLYLNMADEVQTTGILRHLLNTQKDCFIPHYTGTDMKMVRIKSWEDFQSLPETKWKIKQPADSDIRENALDTGGLDVILIPGLGFTTDGARLGRGKGYYDTYLSKCEASGFKPLTIALAFNEQICQSVPTEETDRLIDIVLYPDKGSA